MTSELEQIQKLACGVHLGAESELPTQHETLKDESELDKEGIFQGDHVDKGQG
jgi:hypothetical protein